MATDSTTAVQGQDSSSTDGSESVAAATSASRQYHGFPWRAATVGLLLIAPIVFWIEYTEIVTQAADLVAMSLIISVVAALLALIALNQLIRRLSPRHAFSQSELLLIYAINASTVCISGLGMMQFLVTELPASQHFASSQNHWDNWRHYLRAWALPSPSVVPEFYTGHTTFFNSANLAGWIGPIVVWSLFLCTLLFCGYCIATLLRRQWVERERLLFPIAAIPLEITQNGGNAPIFRNGVFWFGFIVATTLEVLATLHYTVSPGIPYVPIKPNEPLFNMGQWFTTPPWNGIGTLELAVYPMVIGLAYLLSLDVSFSFWFFYVLLKLENVFAVAVGFKDPGAPPAVSKIPYPDQQAEGAFTALAIVSVFYAWPHLKAAYRHAFTPAAKRDPNYNDDREPMPYRLAFLGFFVSAALLISFGIAIGMSPIVAAAFFVLYLLWTVTATRLRAEAGLPWLVAPWAMISGTLIDTAGPRNFSAETIVATANFRWFDSDVRTLPMQQQMECMKIADDGMTGNRLINPRHMTVCILIGIVVSVIASWCSLLGIYYHIGAGTATADYWRTWTGQNTFDRVQTWLTNPQPVDNMALRWIGGGALFTILLSMMRMRFIWWPFHPVGYAASVAGTDWIWFPVLVGWLIKQLVLRYGGLQTYRRALPFFIGLVVGDYAISCILALSDELLGIKGYRTFPI